MDISGSFDTLRIALGNLTDNQKMRLADKYTKAYLVNFIAEMKRTIAIEAKTRVQSKIATYFTGGYSTGALFDSIYYTIEGYDIQIHSTKSYFAILNEGFGSFDMKAALMKVGKPIPIRLPGGRIIFRWPGEQSVQESKRRENLIIGPLRNNKFSTKKGNLLKYVSTKNWIHPGVQGKHIFEIVEREMEPWIESYIKSQTDNLLITIPDVPFSETQDGYVYYSQRSASGQFKKWGY